MMGRLNHDQGQFFYSFRLGEAVPDDHPVRDIARVLDLSWVHAELAPFYPEVGRPSIDPELMLRMLIVGYAFAIRSERALCREVQVNLAYRWFCGLSIEDKVPDHSAFSRARHERFRASDMFRQVFERVVEACIAAGLVGGEGFAVDASLIAADANKQRSIPGTEWRKTCAGETTTRPIREYLASLDDAAFGAASEVTPKFVSPSDPAAQWTGAMRGPAFFAYADNYRQVRHHRRRQSLACNPPSGGRRREDHDRANAGAFRPQARVSSCRYGLRVGGDAQLARQRQKD